MLASLPMESSSGDGSHDHTPCQGQNTLLTQGYTPEIASLVHQSIVQDIKIANKTRSEKPLAVSSAMPAQINPHTTAMTSSSSDDARAGGVASGASGDSIQYKFTYQNRAVLYVGIEDMNVDTAFKEAPELEAAIASALGEKQTSGAPVPSLAVAPAAT